MKKYTFQEPDQIYRGIDLWMVNDRLDDDEIINQVKEFKNKGLGTVIFRTYNGLISDYPGQEFKHKVRVAVDAAKNYGLNIALQAGFMPAAIPELPQKYMLCRIYPVKTDELNGDETVLATYENIAYTFGYAKSGINMLDPEAVDWYINLTYEKMWESFSDEFGKTIKYIWVDEPRFENRYLTWLPDMEKIFYEKFGYSITENLLSLYHKVGDYKKIRYDYFTLLRNRMESCYYSKLCDWGRKNGLQISGHLMGEERLTTQISQAIAVMPYYKYFDVPGFDFLRCNHDWYDKPVHRNTVRVDADADRSMDIASIQCVSAAEQAGCKNVLCEMYGVTSTAFNFRDQMHLFDYFASIGVNCQCMHALFYSPRGFRKRFYPQTFNVYQPYWSHFRDMKDYVARVSNFVSMGETIADVMVLHPLETAYGLYMGLTDTTDESPREEVNDYDRRYYKLITDLTCMQIPYRLGDMRTIEVLGKVENGRFILGEKSFKTVVLSEIEVLSSRVLELLCKFSEQGGRVLIYGSVPCRLNGAENSAVTEKILNFDGMKLFENRREFLKAIKDVSGTPKCEWEGDSSKITINPRRNGNILYYTFHNCDCRKGKKGKLLLDGIYRVLVFDAERNTMSDAQTYADGSKTIVLINLPIGGSFHIVAEPCNRISLREMYNERYTVMPLKFEKCTPCAENLFVIDLCRYKRADMTEYSEIETDVEHITDILKQQDYSGEIKLQFRFFADYCPKNLKLVAEEPETMKITLNGKNVVWDDLGYYYSKAYRISKLPDIKCGENVIEIEKFYTPQKQLPIRDDMKHLFELFRAPVGIDLERMYLLGDFNVEVLPEKSFGVGVRRYCEEPVIIAKKTLFPVSDITSHGYPFYPGEVEYEGKFFYNRKADDNTDIVIKIGEYNACGAAIKVNGKDAGSINRDPYELSIKDFIRNGENTISIRLCNTPRNMIGMSHINSCDLTGSSRQTWIIAMDGQTKDNLGFPNVINSYMTAPYGIGDVQIHFRD